MAYPKEQQEIVARVGPTWCFTHGEAMPCASCAQLEIDHPFLGRCMDCKAEYAKEGEGNTRGCSCYNGCLVREKGFYSYP